MTRARRAMETSVPRHGPGEMSPGLPQGECAWLGKPGKIGMLDLASISQLSLAGQCRNKSGGMTAGGFHQSSNELLM